MYLHYSNELSLQEKLNILADAAKYDVACTSSGSRRKGKKGYLGNSVAAGVCHSFSGDGRCISLLKILLSNDCIYDCKYCQSRCSNSQTRATFSPEEICTLVMEFYKRNYIEGLFLSSAVCKNPVYTMERMYETIYLLRNRYHFNGYIHVKAIPNAPFELIESIGYLADRMSINMELPTADSLKLLAPNKTRTSILTPMRQIQQQIADTRLSIGKSAQMERNRANRYLPNSIFSKNNIVSSEKMLSDTQMPPTASQKPIPAAPVVKNAASLGNSVDSLEKNDNPTSSSVKTGNSQANDMVSFLTSKNKPGLSTMHSVKQAPFVPAGQSTQMIIGATPETDYQILSITQALYQHFDLKRVFYSAYIPINEDDALPALNTAPPLLREHRLYQADWLLRYYGFHAEELLSPERPDFNLSLDPKCDWALRHLEQFPIDVATADYQTLLRVPGIGNKSALRIIQARKCGSLSFEALKKMGTVLKRAQYFITCNGKMMPTLRLEEAYITRQLIGTPNASIWDLAHPEQHYEQLTLQNMFSGVF